MRASISKAFLSAVVFLAAAAAADAQDQTNFFRINDTAGLMTGQSGVYTVNTKNAAGFSLDYTPPTQVVQSTHIQFDAAYVNDKPFPHNIGAIWELGMTFPGVPVPGTYPACPQGSTDCAPPLLLVEYFDNLVGGGVVTTVSGSFTISQVTLTTDGQHVTSLIGTFVMKIKRGDRSENVSGSFLFNSSPGAGSGGGGAGGGTGGSGGSGGGTTTTVPVITFPDAFFDHAVTLGNAQSVQVPFSVFVPPGFSNDVTLSASGSPDGLTFSFDHAFFPAPGSGDGVLTISAGPDTFPTDRQVAITATFLDANGIPVTSTTTFIVTFDCSPPLILGINQPKNTFVSRGSAATVSVTPAGSGPFKYQWYAGASGLTHFPVAGATDRTFTTPAVTSPREFWVRVTNACGTADSNTVLVAPR